MEFWSFIYKEDYTYFSGNVKVVFQEELAKLAYQTHWTSTILAFGATEREIFFLTKHLLNEKEIFDERVNALTIEWEYYLEELKKATFLSSEMGFDI